MMSEPMESHGRGMLGYVLRYLSVDTFKLAIVVGYRSSDRTFRIRLWRAATKQWTKGKTSVRLDELAPLTPEEKSARADVIAHAFIHARTVLGLRPYA